MNKTHSRVTRRSRINNRSRRRGNVIILVMAGFTTLMGCAAISVDYGMSVNIKNKLQRSCDAAALAAASQFKGTTSDQYNAIQKAKLIAVSNGITVNDADVTFPSATRVRVQSSVRRNFFFGAAIGVPNGIVSASAVAGRSSVTGLMNAIPMGITNKTYETYRVTATNPTPPIVNLALTRNTQEKFGPLNSDTVNGSTTHNAVALDLRISNSGNSGALFQDNLQSGSPVVAKIQQSIDPLGSSVTSQGNKLKQAIDARIAAAALPPYNDPVVNSAGGSNYTFPNFPDNDPRIVWVLVGADGYDANNSNPKLNLKYFARAYITGPVEFTRGSDPQATIPLRLMSSGEVSSNTPNVIVSEDSTYYDTGSYAIRLLG